jgi:hypothetical protein
MADSAQQITCRKIDCQVASTGKCADGHDPLASCPNYGNHPIESSDAYDGELDSTESATIGPGRIQLPAGDALTSDEVDQFLRWRDGTFVCIIGDSHSGKTTLISALYDRFLRGDFAGLGFAGSRSLVALERRSHHGRVDSGRLSPETAHTSLQDGLRYFHFALVASGDPTKRTDLLLSDRSGEMYRKARDNAAEVKKLPEIGQANRVVLLLDGGRAANPVERHGALQSVRQSLRVLLDNGGIDGTSIVQIVTTKVDLISASAEAPSCRDSISAFCQRLTTDFGTRLGSLSFHDIAARDPTGGLAAAHGLNSLLQDWTTPRPHNARFIPRPIVLQSEFDRLLDRTPMELLP